MCNSITRCLCLLLSSSKLHNLASVPRLEEKKGKKRPEKQSAHTDRKVCWTQEALIRIVNLGCCLSWHWMWARVWHKRLLTLGSWCENSHENSRASWKKRVKKKKKEKKRVFFRWAWSHKRWLFSTHQWMQKCLATRTLFFSLFSKLADFGWVEKAARLKEQRLSSCWLLGQQSSSSADDFWCLCNNVKWNCELKVTQCKLSKLQSVYTFKRAHKLEPKLQQQQLNRSPIKHNNLIIIINNILESCAFFFDSLLSFFNELGSEKSKEGNESEVEECATLWCSSAANKLLAFCRRHTNTQSFACFSSMQEATAKAASTSRRQRQLHLFGAHLKHSQSRRSFPPFASALMPTWWWVWCFLLASKHFKRSLARHKLTQLGKRVEKWAPNASGRRVEFCAQAKRLLISLNFVALLLFFPFFLYLCIKVAFYSLYYAALIAHNQKAAQQDKLCLS